MKRRRRTTGGHGTGYAVMELLVLILLISIVVSGWIVLPSGIWPFSNQKQPTVSQQATESNSDSLSNSSEDSLYHWVYSQVEQGKQIVSFTADSMELAQETLKNILRQPEFFWLDSYTLTSTAAGDFEARFEFKYDDPQSLRRQVEQVTQEALACIPQEAGDYEIALTLHDWLCDHIQYDFSEDRSDQDIYGALVNGRCVCAGYSAAYEYLLRRAGVEAATVEGTAGVEEPPEPHAWTKLVLEGDVYYTDITWDDQEEHPNGHVYSWFAVTSAFMGKSHFVDGDSEDEMPPSTAVSCNYYVRNGYMLELFSIQRVEEIFSSQTGNLLMIAAADEDIFKQLYALADDAQEMNALLSRTGHPCQQYVIYSSPGSLSLDVFINS